MPSQPPIPPLLFPYFTLPPTSLTLLTSTLTTSTNWLLLRYLYSAVKPPPDHLPPYTLQPQDHVKTGLSERTKTHVILLSYLRDLSFWKDGTKKLGLDLSQVTFIDGLNTGLGLGKAGVDQVEMEIVGTVQRVKSTDGIGRVVLMMDGLDFLLAAGEVGVEGMLDMLGEVREVRILM